MFNVENYQKRIVLSVLIINYRKEAYNQEIKDYKTIREFNENLGILIWLSLGIIFGENDLKVCNGAASALWFNFGHNCIDGSRIYVENKIYDKFAEMMIEKANQESLKIFYVQKQNKNHNVTRTS